MCHSFAALYWEPVYTRENIVSEPDYPHTVPELPSSVKSRMHVVILAGGQICSHNLNLLVVNSVLLSVINKCLIVFFIVFTLLSVGNKTR